MIIIAIAGCNSGSDLIRVGLALPGCQLVECCAEGRHEIGEALSESRGRGVFEVNVAVVADDKYGGSIGRRSPTHIPSKA